jgi:hypothetical protein
MTSKRLEAINRRTRIVQAIHAGMAYREIAELERVSRKFVSRVGIESGIRRNAPHTKGDTMFQKHQVESSLLSELEFDAANRQMIATFKSNGSRYRYDGVNPSVFESVLGAPSVGSAFNEMIKGKYPSQKIG